MMARVWSAGVCLALLAVLSRAYAQVNAEDTNESAYRPAALAQVLGGTARSQNDEAELAGAGDWFTTTATFTGAKRRPSGRLRPLISAWVSGRGEGSDVTEMFFSGDLPELQFEQGGRKYWLLGGLPAGLGFDVYPAGQKLVLYLQRVGFASGTPVAVLRMAKLPGGATTAAAAGGQRLRGARIGEGERRQVAVFKTGSVRFRYAGIDYTLPLDLSGRHSIAPGLYRYANGVRTALLEYGKGDTDYLLLRVSVPEDGQAPSVLPYLVLKGRIVPPIDVSACDTEIREAGKSAARGAIDCEGVASALLRNLDFDAR